ncbi:C6 finger domain protein, putative [Talaromyces stipitatus ATCC 10500]|uniref:C6 finger domain protein, putative n=1 Tax=Talaromyces stipitatus (strain ATCC 10500 / CBS 375.48 / QM 6759 / NRRL 1006) TaxID=441959 RepID=B8MPZ7_TALSN|nr:C6 finger domain protein, putative [Talaromyces stipitatus ATCC 10500]EED12887.1 C6 finger domain protein, putative [Talaromyces stipitatus ATCC 10500]
MNIPSQQDHQAAEGLASLGNNFGDMDRYQGDMTPQQYHSPGSPAPKNVAFELLLDENSKIRARIPMRVQIFPHDTTDSIVTTVKNFYGIYDGVASGVSFEDEHGTTLIARYENLRNNMTVYVRVIPVHSYADSYEPHYHGMTTMDGRKRPSLGEPFQMVPTTGQGHLYGSSSSRPLSRTRRPSTSPSGRGRRSASQHKGSTRNGVKSRGSSAHGSFAEDPISGYSDSEGGHGSISGSRKARSEQFASSEISMDNIVQESRRKKPKFESSELPLFAPPQVPLTTSTSSISPQRRSIGNDGEPSPFARPTHRPLNNKHPLPSPQSYGYSEHGYGNGSAKSSLYSNGVFTDNGHRSRLSGSSVPGSANRQTASGILPTPDPTIASCISDEDVALQLIRLGDASNFSHGRNSTSTLDDAFSGAADASSTGATSDGDFSDNEDDQELPPRSRQRVESSPLLPPGHVKQSYKRLDDILPSYDSTDASADEGEEYHQTSDPVKDEYHDDDYEGADAPRAKKQKVKSDSVSSSKSRATKSAPAKPTKNGKARPVARKSKSSLPSATGPKTETALQTLSPAPSRKTSGSGVNFQHQLAADEEDLSTKPRCQRCRKSKKGCDRQRPCGRCKDAGIGLEGCISEDEGNGRKGRYGRHMGVPIKKTVEPGAVIDAVGLPTPATPAESVASGDKNKKRKR